jgi:ATP-binding cassette subfamily B protein
MARRLRLRMQVERADCGAACLTAVLDHYGKHLSMEQVREVTGSGRDGTTARTLVEAARWFGLDARGVRADIGDLGLLPRGTLLYWDMSHFVVLDRVNRRSVRILDPALGRRTVPKDELDRSYTGVAIMLEPGPAFERAEQRRGSVLRYLRPILFERTTLGSVIGTSALLRVAGLALPLMTALVVDRVVPHRDRSLMTVIVASFAVVIGFNFFSSLVRGRLLLNLRIRVDYVTTMRFVEHLAALPYSFHLRRSSGDLLNRLRSNATVREVFTTSAVSTLLDGSFASLYLALLIAISPPMAILAVGLATGQAISLVLSRRAAHRLTSTGLLAEARSQSFSMQFLAGIGTLKASGTEPRAVERFSEVFTEELAASLAKGRLGILVDAATGLLRSAAPIVLLTVAAMQVVDGHLSLGAALAVNALAAGFLGPIDGLITCSQSLVFLRSYIDRLDDVFETAPEQDPAMVRPAPALTGRIRADGVSFRYDPLSADVVRDVTLEIRPGSFVAIVGRSGSGKTTLAHVLLGLYRPSAGAVLHDGMDLSGLDVRTVRSQLGVVTQDPYLFSESIRENVAFADPRMPLERVVDAARMAAVHDDIAAMPLGYDTMVGEGGALLSGGQRQRVAIARAIAARPRVMLLDEATSHLDAIAEHTVYDGLASMQCTRIVVAHRLSTVVGADLIIVMDDGQVVGTGTHESLLATNEAYAALVRRQMPGGAPEPAPASEPVVAAPTGPVGGPAALPAALPAAPPDGPPLESTAAAIARLLAARAADALARLAQPRP